MTGKSGVACIVLRGGSAAGCSSGPNAGGFTVVVDARLESTRLAGGDLRLDGHLIESVDQIRWRPSVRRAVGRADEV